MSQPISIAMIVRDESAHLAQCLESARQIADEICVVDTGSQDDTPAIARALGARVDFFPWCDDFAAARNASLALCTGDWIFVLDADERLAESDIAEIRRLAEGPMDCCYRLMTRNYTNAETVGEFRRCAPGDPHAQGFAGWYPSWKVRLFPNGTGARYEGQIHELIRKSLEEKGIRVVDSSVVIHHYPFLRDATRVQEKQRLYVQLGRAKAYTSPTDPTAHAQLGHQYAELGDYARAAAAYGESLKHDPRNALVLKDLGGVLHLMGRSAEAKKALRLALRHDPGLGEAWRNLGVIHAAQEEWSAAVDCFAKATELEAAWTDGPRYLSVALDRVGRLAEAAQAARRAVELGPASVEALDLYVDQMRRLGRSEEGRSLLERLRDEAGTNAALDNAIRRGRRG